MSEYIKFFASLLRSKSLLRVPQRGTSFMRYRARNEPRARQLFGRRPVSEPKAVKQSESGAAERRMVSRFSLISRPVSNGFEVSSKAIAVCKLAESMVLNWLSA